MSLKYIVALLYNVNMKIAYIGQKGVLPAEKAGGIEKRVFEVGKRMCEKGHSVTVFARGKHMKKRPKFVEGMKIVYIPTIYTKNLEAIIYTFFATIRALFNDFDIYHFHGVGPSTLSFLPRIFKPKSKVIVTFHARDQFHQKWGFIGRFYLRFGEWCSVNFPHYFITVSHILQVVCREEYGKQGVYIPNGAEIKNTQKRDYLDKIGLKEKGYILSVGRLLPVKGVHHLIEAYKQIKTDKELIIVGDGNLNYIDRLEKMADGDWRIRFLGFKTGEELDQLFANAYLLVQASESEGLPLTVLEAMSFGVAPLVSDIGGNKEAIHNTGFTFKSMDIGDLKSKLISLLNNEELVREEGEEAKTAIAVNFNWDLVANHEEEVYITSLH